MSIVLFFVLSGFFLAALLGAVERSRKLLGIAGACLVVLACIIVFVKPVQLPSLRQLRYGTSSTTSSLPPADGKGATGSAGAAVTNSTVPASSTGSAAPAGTTTAP